MKQTLLLILILLATVVHGLAATYTVTNTNDSGPGSLRNAISNADSAAGDDMIAFSIPDCPNVGCRIILTTGALVITGSSGAITISNPSGPASLIISGNNTSQVFTTAGANLITLDGLTMENGTGHYGGAVYNEGSVLTISNSVIRSNRAVFGGGIFNKGFSITSEFANSLIVTKSEISGNVATSDLNPSFGGGIFADDASNVLVRDSTIADNSAVDSGGGIGLSGYENGAPTADIENSTISGNTSGNGGGIDAYGSIVRITNSTITMNSAQSYAGGVTVSGSSLFTRNSIIAGNTLSDIYNDFGILNDLGNNLIGVPAMIGPLADNGGPTRTHALLAGSPAINAGNNCVLTEYGCGDGNPALITDQSGYPRIGTIDIGAFEFRLTTAALGSISGKAIGPDGRPIANAAITLTDVDGNMRAAKTRASGAYKFSDLPIRTFYVLDGGHKKYTFTPVTLFLLGDITDENLSAVNQRHK